MGTLSLLLIGALGCGGAGGAEATAGGGTSEATSAGALADVTAVSVSDDPGDYTFAVTVLSPDVDCSRYADWWEVLTEDGELVFRRILNHSHPDEQPFTRDGGPVAVAADQVVIVRAHLSTDGYGGAAMKGTAAGGFQAAEVAADFAAAVASQEPQVEDCWY